jgi:hypothetical protein
VWLSINRNPEELFELDARLKVKANRNIEGAATDNR